MDKNRLDLELFNRGLAQSRMKAEKLIKKGFVSVNGKKIFKPGTKVSPGDKIVLEQVFKYVGQGGYKLEAGIENFGIDVSGKIVVDIGSSTGGFTDCLLQYGAEFVYAIDVGTSQLDESLQGNPKIASLENVDIRKLEGLPVLADLAVIDVSFISLRKVLPHVNKFLKKNGEIIALVKPQFEGGRGFVDKRGVANEVLRDGVVKSLLNWIKENGWEVNGFMESPIKGGKGNIEYLVYLKL